jgi:hypothetical protein
MGVHSSDDSISCLDLGKFSSIVHNVGPLYEFWRDALCSRFQFISNFRLEGGDLSEFTSAESCS